MESADLLSICLTALISVFFVLTILAALMRLIIFIFPEKAATDDAAVVAALNTVYQKMYPGSKISKIEEIT